MYSEQNRAFSYAVLASITLHGVLLFGVSQRERPRPPEPQMPLVARLVEPVAPAPATPAPAPTAIPSEVRPPPVERPKPRPKAKAAKPDAPKPVEKAMPARRPEPAPSPEPPAVAQNPPTPETAPPAPTARIVEEPPVAEPMLDPRSVAEYRLQIIGAAPRYKRYPRVARENNWEGLVSLRMVFAPSGRLASLSVTKTSGYDVLDKQATEMFRSAAEAVPVPPLLRGKEFAVDVAAVYGLTD
jgi:protein TonB